MNLPSGFLAVDPDGHEFWYEKEPELGKNFEGILTWIAVSGTKCIYVGKKDMKNLDFTKSLQKV